MTITTRLFGKSGPPVTQVGLGGEGVLRTHGREPEAKAVIEQAAAQGITYFDSAQAYAGSQGYYGNFWRGHQELRSGIFQTSKSAARDYRGAKADLAESLETMGLDRLDLWQIHDLRTRQDIEEIEGPGGALRAFVEAKDAGLVRFLGVTGHHAPKILEHAVKNWPVDSVLMPVNPAEAVLGGFLDQGHGRCQGSRPGCYRHEGAGRLALHLPAGWGDGGAAPALCPFPGDQHGHCGLHKRQGGAGAGPRGQRVSAPGSRGGEEAAGAVPAPCQETGVLPGSDLGERGA